MSIEYTPVSISVLLTWCVHVYRKNQLQILMLGTSSTCFNHWRRSWNSQQLESFPFVWKWFLLFTATCCMPRSLAKWPVSCC